MIADRTTPVTRRRLLGGALALPAAALCSPAMARAVEDLAPLPETADGYLFLTRREAATIEALCDRLIPPGGPGPGALEARVPRFLDRALRSSYGLGEGHYKQGPFAQGTPEQGYQLPLRPHELYRVALADLDEWSEVAHGTPFAALDASVQDDAIALMASGELALADVPAAVFFPTLWFDVRSGYFADPIHGGNEGMAAWRMVGFPGAYTDLRPHLGADEPVSIEPVSLAQVLSIDLAGRPVGPTSTTSEER